MTLSDYGVIVIVITLIELRFSVSRLMRCSVAVAKDCKNDELKKRLAAILAAGAIAIGCCGCVSTNRETVTVTRRTPTEDGGFIEKTQQQSTGSVSADLGAVAKGIGSLTSLGLGGGAGAIGLGVLGYFLRRKKPILEQNKE